MMGRAPFLRNGNSQLENSRSNAMAMFGNFCFSVVVLTVLVRTILAVNYQPDGHLFRPADMITTFFTSTSNAMFKSDNTVQLILWPITTFFTSVLACEIWFRGLIMITIPTSHATSHSVDYDSYIPRFPKPANDQSVEYQIAF